MLTISNTGHLQGWIRVMGQSSLRLCSACAHAVCKFLHILYCISIGRVDSCGSKLTAFAYRHKTGQIMESDNYNYMLHYTV